MKMLKGSSLLAGVALAAGMWCCAQQLPVPVTMHVTAPKGAVLRHATIAIAAGAGEPFSFYKSDARGDVTISLAPGAHDLRLDVRGYPMTYEHVEVAEAATITVVLGHGTAARPARAVAATPSVAIPRAPVPQKGAANPGSAAPAARRTNPSGGTDPLQAYTSCYFPDGLQIVSVDPLDAGVTSRSVDTADGPQQIDLVAGERVMLAYPFTDFFANVKAEELPADRYPALKAALLANLNYLETQPGGPEDVQSLPANLHGFEVHGNNREKLEGSVLGMYLLFDDQNHVATTIYFLNQESWRRKFQTMDEYARLRDHFLTTYTGCVRENQATEK
ncbi:MAG TPA: hypothetical protein VMD92_13705 [Acidobacteriaceae bacterium]|nr:hypothetical protein [Acidobacteriaceae bacterium]